MTEREIWEAVVHSDTSLRQKYIRPADARPGKKQAPQSDALRRLRIWDAGRGDYSKA